jgi:hypothetical protein
MCQDRVLPEQFSAIDAWIAKQKEPDVVPIEPSKDGEEYRLGSFDIGSEP